MTRFLPLFLLLNILLGCNGGSQKPAQELRLISLNPILTATVCDLGLGSKLVGRDMLSTAPDSVLKVKEVGYNRTVKAEALIALKPTHILADPQEVNDQVLQQLRTAGVQVLLHHLDGKPATSLRMFAELGKQLGQEAAGKALAQRVQTSLDSLQQRVKAAPLQPAPKVICVYSRSANIGLAAFGQGTAIDEQIQLLGATNALNFKDVARLSPEAVLQAKPDFILAPYNSAELYGGGAGLLNQEVLKPTPAGKNKAVLVVDNIDFFGFHSRSVPMLSKLYDLLSAAKPQSNRH